VLEVCLRITVAPNGPCSQAKLTAASTTRHTLAEEVRTWTPAKRPIPAILASRLAYNPHSRDSRGLVQQVVHVLAMNLDRIDRHLCAREYVNNPLRSTGC
jgi:hypothetical protein